MKEAWQARKEHLPRHRHKNDGQVLDRKQGIILEICRSPCLFLGSNGALENGRHRRISLSRVPGHYAASLKGWKTMASSLVQYKI